jgi:TetR/AcrR family hemagglutinin/protease transcriptional regulator
MTTQIEPKTNVRAAPGKRTKAAKAATVTKAAKAAGRSSPRRRLPPAERRAQLLDTALEVFARRGFGRAGHAEIADAADVAVSTVFVYFPTRKALVAAVLAEVGRYYLELALSAHDPNLPCRAVLLAHREAFHSSLETHPHHSRIALDWSTAIREDLWPQYIEFIDELVANHVRTIERGQREGDVAASIDADTSARMLIGSSQMTAQLRLAGTSDAQVARISELLIDAALGQLAPA